MGEKQVKFVAVRPDGTVCGPVGDTYAEVQYALQHGHAAVGASGKWIDILKAGYSVCKARIELVTE